MIPSDKLQDAGVTDEVINEHRNLIAAWVINAINSGQLEGKPDSCPLLGELRVLDNNTGNSEVGSGNGKAGQEDSSIVSDGESEYTLLEEADSDGESTLGIYVS
jgi:hypothetical protein